MDRGHRAILKTGVVLGWIFLALSVGGQAQPSPAPGQAAFPQNQPDAPAPPTGSATPWVQAPPAQANTGATVTPSPKPTPASGPKPSVTPAPKPPVPKAAPPPADRTAEETKAKMLRERERELGQTPPPQDPGQPAPPRDEQTTLQNNYRIWNKLLPEEQQAILGQAGRRIREETEQAYALTGLNLNNDQREVFALRYRQERRRLERELQEKSNGERNRRVPLILEQLKREFAKSSSSNNGAPKTMPVPAPTPSAAAAPASSPAKTP